MTKGLCKGPDEQSWTSKRSTYEPTVMVYNMYFVKIIDKIESQPGAWYGIRLSVFRTEGESEEKVGEYSRDYRHLFSTFYPFRKNEKDYALYSPSYSVTRVMELPSCKDIGGEEPSPHGFCPVDFYVPCYIEREWTKGNNMGLKFVVNEPSAKDLIESDFSKPVSPILYYPFGFVAGCIWGDESSWKIQYLDLEQVEAGIIKRDERFGYIKMPDKLTLKDSIDLADYNCDPSGEDSNSIIISVQHRFDLGTGKILE